MPIKFDVRNRFSGQVQFTAELDCDESSSYSVKLGLAVNWAIKADANLAGANLADANLAGANLADANLAGANLADANLAGANLADANLAGANLADANLAGANLADANLADANLAGAYLAGAYLAGANLADANLAGAYLADANLAGAYLADVNLAGADLADANLAGAYLADANLAGAYLADANLAGANLADANLAGANLAGAKGIAPERCTPLLMLLDQPGKIRAYKLVDASLRSPIKSSGKLTYDIGATIAVKGANTDPQDHCAAGVNVATLDWCLKNWSKGYRIVVVEFEAKDIACIPTASDGKFRLHQCTVIAEKPLDLVALGLVKKEKEAA